MLDILRRLLRALLATAGAGGHRPARRGDFVVVERNGIAYIEPRRPQ